ncbi:hypothetical protein QWZ10_09795 [Paracoccus cavernae]|uniref:Uncharacterized protein n=1 Tax=Paracoccus cavernae TaxID=1571207 RepID=A0ABT8D7Y3_9RHOB|nr:hypothetical protein [Paracoccus cavernae]
MRLVTAFLVMGLASAGPGFAQSEDERLWSCDTSLSGERISVNYVRDEAYRANVGKMESRFARFGKVTCPGYVTLREILRRNEMVDDGSYCLLWDQSSDTFVGAQKGPRKANAVCGKTFCHRVNGAKAAALQEGRAAANAGYEAVTQRPGAAILSAATGPMAGKIEGAGAAAAGLPPRPWRWVRFWSVLRQPAGRCGIAPTGPAPTPPQPSLWPRPSPMSRVKRICRSASRPARIRRIARSGPQRYPRRSRPPLPMPQHRSEPPLCRLRPGASGSNRALIVISAPAAPLCGLGALRLAMKQPESGFEGEQDTPRGWP